jgi:hypothetical protein
VGSRLAVDPVSYDAASMAFGTEIAGEVQRAALGLLDGLAGSGEMAGADPAGHAWASAYDDAATTTLGVTQDVVNGCFQLAALLQQTGFNYIRADSSSTAGGVALLPDTTAYASCSVQLNRPPSAAGGSLPTPTGWWVIEHTVGYVWPGGHQGRLRAAAAVWRAAAIAIGDATLYVQGALGCITSQVSPEVDDAMTACQAMDRHLWDLVATYEAVARTCSEFADYIDQAHSAVEHELASFLQWSAAIQGVGLVAAFVTGGGSELVAQDAQAERIAATAGKVGSIIARLIELARGLAETTSAAATRVVEISRNLRGLLGARISVAATGAVRALPAASESAEAVADGRLAAAVTARAFPRLSMTRFQIERKFKHAVDFGVTEGKGASGYKTFAEAIERLVADPTTTRVIGTYRNEPAILNYNATTRLVVAQSPDGAFISGWQMSKRQLHYVIEHGSLGGG